jgi:hypothetical protein
MIRGKEAEDSVGLAITATCFPCTTEIGYSFESMVGHSITLEPVSRRISATCILIAVRIAVQRWNLKLDVPLSHTVSNNPWQRGITQRYLYHGIEACERLRPHERYELRWSRSDERSG